MSKLKVLEQPTANSKNRNHDRKIRSQTKGIPSMICDTNNFDIETKYMVKERRLKSTCLHDGTLSTREGFLQLRVATVMTKK